ncbi:MAG: hypothetical protein ACPGF8_02160 [Opitutales bacterium]
MRQNKASAQKLYIDRIIPHRLGMVDLLYYALTEMTFKDGAKPLKLYISGEPKLVGNTNAFSNPAIEAGIMSGRFLLEFLGLKCAKDDSSKLAHRKRGSGRNDDLFIEDFEHNGIPLSKITIDDVKRQYPGPPEDAESSLARVIHIANKGIAHPTVGRHHNDDDYQMLEIAARGIRALTISYFYTGLSIEAPKSPLQPPHG